MTADKETREAVLGNVVAALEMLEACREFAALVPEVRVNLVYALPGARSPQDVAAVEGRITVVGGYPRASGLPHWGKSDHMARLLIELGKHDPTLRGGINFKWDARLNKIVQDFAREKGLRFGWIDRNQEPPSASVIDGSSAPWKVSHLVKQYGGPPRLFYEAEAPGKEPLYYAVGADAVEAASIAIGIAHRYAGS